MRHYPERLHLEPTGFVPDLALRPPGSKSLSNRALLLAAATPARHPVKLTGVLESEDVEVMVDSLRKLGYQLEWNREQSEVLFPVQDRQALPRSASDLFIANSGTSMRFLTALVATGKGSYRIDGNARMRERPIADLLDALNTIPGVEARSERQNGFPPVIVTANGSRSANKIRVRSETSSQFLSGLLMAAPILSDTPVTLEVDGPAVSEPYIQMTIDLMRKWGFALANEGLRTFVVEPVGSRESPELNAMEPDASAASYLWGAAAITGGRVEVVGLSRNSSQGDVAFVDLLAQMGCKVDSTPRGIAVTGSTLRGIDVDMNAISDVMMTLAVVACFAEGPTTIRNVAHVRHKETDRIAATAKELRKVGALVDERPDGLTITPRALQGAELETYDDHRMAMSLSMLGLKVPGITLLNPGCVVKTYPSYWEDYARLQDVPPSFYQGS